MKLFHRFLKKQVGFPGIVILNVSEKVIFHLKRLSEVRREGEKKMREKNPKLSCTCPQGYRVFTNPNHMGNGWAGNPITLCAAEKKIQTKLSKLPISKRL